MFSLTTNYIFQEMNKRLGISNENTLCCKSEEQCQPVKNVRTSVAPFESEEIQDKTTQTTNNIFSNFSNLLQNVFNNNFFGWNSNTQSSVSVDSRSTNAQSSSNNRNNWFSSQYSRNKVRNYISRGRGKQKFCQKSKQYKQKQYF